jgi:uncharacterized membrane protein YdjX (TVP38/TMEM64 family)
MKITNIAEKIKSVDDLRRYVLTYEKYAIPMFIILQFLQVIILPIPSIITIGAGIALFGLLNGILFSLVGILSASFVAFYIGRILGYKTVSWLIGSKNLNKGLELAKGKDKLMLTVMFLLPFFPDDILCFVAGITTMSQFYFAVMITITRVIAIGMTALTLSEKLMPLNTWWGVCFWLLFLCITVIICILIYNMPKGKVDGKNDSSY